MEWEWLGPWDRCCRQICPDFVVPGLWDRSCDSDLRSGSKWACLWADSICHISYRLWAVGRLYSGIEPNSWCGCYARTYGQNAVPFLRTSHNLQFINPLRRLLRKDTRGSTCKDDLAVLVSWCGGCVVACGWLNFDLNKYLLRILP